MLSIQFGASLAKQLFSDVGSAGTAGLRVFFSAIILLAASRPFKNKDLIVQIFKNKSDLKIIILYGLSLGFMNLLFYLSLEKIPLGLAVTLEFLGPLAVAIYFSRKLKHILWVACALAGLSILFLLTDHETLADIKGVYFALAAGALWGAYIILGKKISKTSYPSLVISGVGMTFAAVGAVPVGLYYNAGPMLQPKFWLPGVFVALLSSAIPYSLEMKAMQKIPERTFGILMSFEPVIATAVGIMILKETLNMNQVLAMCLILIGCIGTSLDRS